jgi:hypothetical protein
MVQLLEDRTVPSGNPVPNVVVRTAQAMVSATDQHVALVAALIGPTGPVNDGTVTFSVFNGTTQVGPTTAPTTVIAGNAGGDYTLPGGTPVGTYTIDASYSGSPEFQAVTGHGSLEVEVTVQSPTTTTVTTNPNAAFSHSDQPVTLSATVTGHNGPVKEGTVTFTVLHDGTPVGDPVMSGTVSNGTATATYTLRGGTAIGSYSVIASYGGGSRNQASASSGPLNGTLTVAASLGAPTTTGVYPQRSAPAVAPGPRDQPVVLRAVLSSPAGLVNEGTVTFTVYTGDSLDGFTQLGQPTTFPVNGGAGAVYTLPAGAIANNAIVVASYSGGPDFQASTSSGSADGFLDESNLGTVNGELATTTTVTTNPTVPYSETDQPMSLGASVTSPGVTVDAGSVTFAVFRGQTVIGGNSQPGGNAPGNFGGFYSLPGRTPPGTYTILAEYSGGLELHGSNIFAGGFGEGRLTVTGVDTQTKVTSVAPVSFSQSSQSVALTASVTSSAGAPVQGGTVTFTVFNGTTQIGQPTDPAPVTLLLDSKGQPSGDEASASYTLPAGTPAGSYTVVAAFSGVAQFKPSRSSGPTNGTLTVSHTLARVTVAAHDATATFSADDQPVTLSASLSSLSPVNEGTVTFSVFKGNALTGGIQVGQDTAPANVHDGTASATFTLPGGTAAGAYAVAADYSGGPDFQPAFRFSIDRNTTGTLTVQQASTSGTGGGSSGTSSTSGGSSVAAGANVQVVEALYDRVLRRAADQSGLAAWIQLLQSGGSPTQVAKGIWESAEHRGLEVDAMYDALLHRLADVAGRSFWVNVLLSGAMDEQQVEAAILTSPEYLSPHQGAVAVVNALYADLFGTAPDSAGAALWDGVAQQSGGAARVVSGLLNSAEEFLRLIDQDYTELLGRAGDAAGTQGWLSQFQAGATSEAVAEDFLASDEFFSHLGGT